jgi:hypothetical protein
MKTSKVHKRLAKIEELITDLTDRYAQGAVHVRAALEGAKVAIAHLKTTVSSPAPSATAKKPETTSAESSKPAKRKLSAAHKRAIREGVQRRLAEKQAVAKKAAPAAKKSAVKKATVKVPTAK